MTDLSPLSSEPILPGSLNLESSAVDSNLRAIRQVEQTWRLPELPDEVRLDLAASGASHTGISRFLSEIDLDMYDEDEEQAEPAPVPTFNVVNGFQQFNEQQLTGFQEASELLRSLRGMRQSEVLDANAVQRFKMRAIEDGYMEAPPGGTIDGSWSPELAAIQRQMQFDEYDRRARGDRPGALPVTGENGVLKMLNDWTSPSGLFRAAVDLDFMWDVGQISNEFSSWGDKWRKVGDSSNPLDFGRNLFDALTGPIDDIVVPALNIALLFSGVGAGVNFARLGMTGMRGIQGAKAFTAAQKLYEVPFIGGVAGRVFPALDNAADAIGAARGLAESSLLANKLVKGGATAKALGQTMQAWRQLPAVIASKRVVQTGMRLGLVSQVENRLLPSYQGKSLGDIDAVGAAADRAFQNPLATTLGELMLAPWTIFEPGTFVRGGREAVAGAFKLFGTTGGRTAFGAMAGAGAGALAGDDTGDVLTGAGIGAVGTAGLPTIGKALKGVGAAGQAAHVPLSKLIGNAGDILRRTSYEALTNDQQMTAVFLRAMEKKLSPEELVEFRSRVESEGFLKAFGDRIGTAGDSTSTGAAMAYVLTSASIDYTAALQAGDRTSKGWRQRYWLARNQLQAQLRVFDENSTIEDVVWSLVSKETASRRGLRRRFETVLQSVQDDPTALAELVSAHNEQAMLTMRQLISPDNLPIDGLGPVEVRNVAKLREADPNARNDAVADYISGTLDSFGNWGEYSHLTTGLRQVIGDGYLTDARIAAPLAEDGRKLKILDSMEEYHEPIDDSVVDWSQHLTDTLLIDRTTNMETWRQRGGYFNPLARELDPTKARFTLQKVGTLTKQEFVAAAKKLEDSSKMFDDWLRVSKLERRVTDDFGVERTVGSIVNEGRIGAMTSHEATQYIAALGLNGRSLDAAAVRRLNRYAKRYGLSVDQMFTKTLDDYATALGTDEMWATKYGLELRPHGADGTVLTRRDLLQHRAKALREEAKFRAATIDTDDLLAQLEEAGKTAEAASMRQYLELADKSGYRIVYGADFLHPDDLLHRTGMFTDINERHMNAMTLGNFFGRKHPERLAANVQRARQRGIARELSRAVGRDLDPEDALVQQATRDLYERVWDPELARNAAMTDDIQHQNWLARRATGVRLADMPKSIADLGLGRHQARVVSELVKAGWTDREAVAIWQGVKASRYADWQDLGLAAIEAKLRSRSQLIDGLRVLGGSPDAGRFRRAAPGAAVGATVGMLQGQAMTDEGESTTGNRLIGAAAGAVLGGATRNLIGAGTNRIVETLDFSTSRWARYGYMADNLSAMRDKMRFALSPFFDISRYTEAFMLNAVGGPNRLDDGTRIGVPLNSSPKALVKAFRKDAINSGLSPLEASNAAERRYRQLVDEMRQASRGNFDPDEVEQLGTWFQDVGIMGFNPTRWKAATFHHLREQGMDPEKAWESVQNMYTYGTHGRTAAEHTVNFVFFPFSFQKKTITHAAEWLADDMVRSVILHDAYQAWQILEEKYDLNEKMKEHLPALEKLQQLNMFAYGLSPGRFGGINRPFVDYIVGDPLSRDPSEAGLIFQLVNPVGVDAGSPDKAKELKDLMGQLVPAINDLHHLLEDAQEQGHVLASPSHMTRAAETAEGYQKWNEYKLGVDAALKPIGASYYDLYNNPGLAELKDQYLRKRLALEQEYPGWVESKLRAQAKRAELEQERQFRLNRVAFAPETASVSDLAFAQFEAELESLKGYLAERGITDWTDAPPDMLDRIRGVAVRKTQEIPGFEMIWNKFYRTDFGPITGPVNG